MVGRVAVEEFNGRLDLRVFSKYIPIDSKQAHSKFSSKKRKV
jgi:hypothetical protein